MKLLNIIEIYTVHSPNATPTTIKRQRTLLDCKLQAAPNVDIVLTKFITGCSLPYSIVDHPLFNDFVRASTGKYCVTFALLVHSSNTFHLIGGAYQPPVRQTLTNKLVPALFEVERQDQAKEMRGVYGTLLIDGRTDLTRGLASSSFVSKQGDHVIDSFDFGVEGQTADVYVQNLEDSLAFVIENNGEVVACCTDNCATMRKTRSDFAKKHPNLLCYACTDHLIDLLMKYYADATICRDIISRVKSIQNVFRKHQRILSALKKVPGYILPTSPSETRWHYSFDLLSNYLSNRQALITCSHSEEVEDEFRDFQGLMNYLYSPEFTAKAKRVKELLKPFKSAILDAESDKCSAEKIVHIWLTLKSSVDSTPVEDWRTPREKTDFVAKFKDHEMALSSGHYAAYFLSPAYSNAKLSVNTKKMAIEFCMANGIAKDWLVAFSANDLSCLGVPAPMFGRK